MKQVSYIMASGVHVVLSAQYATTQVLVYFQFVCTVCVLLHLYMCVCTLY